MERRKRITAIVLTVLFCTALLFSLSFLAREAGHTCIGEECAICNMVLLFEATYRYFGILAAAAAAVGLCAANLHRLAPVNFCANVFSPITLKVKLSE